MIFSNIVSYMYNPEVNQYCAQVPFNNLEVYPELPFIEGTDEDNTLCPTVSELLRQLKLDNGNNGI